MSEFSVRETKDVVRMGCDLASVAANQLVDGFQFYDIFAVIPVIQQIPAVLDGIGKVPSELRDMDADEAQEIVDLVKDRLDLPNDTAETIAEYALQVILNIAKMMSLLK